jgi:hypothetical protein
MGAMKHLWRRLFNGMAALSLTLFLITSGFAFRSKQTNDQVYAVIRGRLIFIASSENDIRFYMQSPLVTNQRITWITQLRWQNNRYHGLPFEYASPFTPTYYPGGVFTCSFAAYFTAIQGGQYSILPTYGIAISWLSLQSVLLLVPIVWVAKTMRTRHVKRMRAKHEYCLNCGYDLRKTPDCCPECGTIPLKVS